MMPQEVMAAYVRGVLEEHDEWDSLHQLQILGWDGENIVNDTLVGIDPAVEPSDYPVLLPVMAAKQMEGRPQDIPYAYLLQFEGWAAVGPGLPPSQRTDRIEVAIAVCADVEGRVWMAEKRRDRPGEISEDFAGPGDTDKAGGGFTDTLRAMAARARCARTTLN